MSGSRHNKSARPVDVAIVTSADFTCFNRDDRLLMPDLVGRSIGEVRRLAAAASMDLHVHGTGHAVEQAPTPGTILEGDNPFVIVRFQPGGEG